ncbi:MAG: RNA 2'-phosphotransferase [Candidatus Aminicenantes bacterium]|nr:MAG: RNA 2'-phosphotransferase [Candidatus Aminicenantes bacterium]
MIHNKVKVSKFLSFTLRHAPQNYGLSLDRYGFAEFRMVLKILTKRFPGLEDEDVKNIVMNDPKKRFQIDDQRIRARYGHSVFVEPLEECRAVPSFLFHGTSPRSLNSIFKRGLIPEKRRFIHLSLSVEEALKVGRRKDNNPVVLKVDTQRASQDGLVFWKEANVYLTKTVAPQYISVYK